MAYEIGSCTLHKLKHILELNISSTKHSGVCITCPMAKQAKLPYNKSTSLSTFPFELIHIDIWGAHRVPTCGNNIYFLTIVGDYSKATWVYLLQYKS